MPPPLLPLAAGAAAALLSLLLWRAFRAGAAPPGPPAASSCSAAETSLIATLLARGDELAGVLSAAIQLRTVSYEDATGRAASLLEASEAAASGTARDASRRGCACCGVPTAAGAAAPGEGERPSTEATTATPAALEESRRAFLALHALLRASFPLLHERLELTVVNTYSLCFIWRGADAARAPVALAAHLDVVPAPDAQLWTPHAPFSGAISDGYVWGRGAIDDKHAVVAMLGAVEALLQSGWAPSRTVCLLLGHDEEVGGFDGAAAIARLLPSLLGGARLEWILDEGLFLISDFFPGVDAPVAVVCNSEKGHLNVELSVQQPAGHSSVPPATSAIGILARAVARLEASPFPAHAAPASTMLRALLPHMSPPARLLFGNAWLTQPLISALLLSRPTSAALLRTTTAVTLIGGGVKSNVMPPLATACVNHRVHPADCIASVLARDAAVIADARVTLRAMEPLEPAPVSSVSSRGFADIGAAVQSVAAAAQRRAPVVSPGLMMGNTDTRWYWSCAQDLYRHCPTELTMEETKLFHGANERIKVDNLARIAAFFGVLLLRAQRE